MYKELELRLADGTTESVPFKATGTTSIRFAQLTKKNLMATITGIISSVGKENYKALIDLSRNMQDETKPSIDSVDPDMLPLLISIASSGELEKISQLAYVMNKQAKAETPSDLSNLSFEDYLDWLEKFDSMEFLTNAVNIINIYMNNTDTSVEQKKADAQPTGK